MSLLTLVLMLVVTNGTEQTGRSGGTDTMMTTLQGRAGEHGAGDAPVPLAVGSALVGRATRVVADHVYL